MENETMYSRKIYIGSREHLLFNFLLAMCAPACPTYTNLRFIYIDMIFAISRIPIYPLVRGY